MQRYNPKEIEAKWQQNWQGKKLYEATEDPNKQKKYVTAMFPYPSGAGLHVGHVRNYSITDVIARYYRQRGYNVLSTIGWDAFGLPAENYAIKTGVSPQASTAQNVINFKKQLSRLGMSYDWSREVNTTDPNYYKWTQWIFTKLYEKNLAYQKESAQWWCETDKTVLANEQVEAGKCWRCGNNVIKKSMKQWFFKITDYADELLENTDALAWPEKIKTMQKNWIGRSEGAAVTFRLGGLGIKDQNIDVFTTAHDTIFGVTFIVLAPEHPVATSYAQYANNALEIQDYVDKAVRKSELDRETNKTKTGVALEGLYAINPANGSKIPVWVADYVLASYGSGAIMAVPGEDERDYEFAKKYDLPIVYTTKQQEFINYQTDIKPNRAQYILANSGEFDGLSFADGRQKIIEKLVDIDAAKEVVQYKMRDWLISRQRYWGTPIPIIHCEKDGAVAVPEIDLPVVLPEVAEYQTDNSGRTALEQVEDWVNVACPTCGEKARRETDTMDGYACSSWYYLRYTDPHNQEKAWDKAKADYWMSIDYYCGGDHAVSHLLYSRFWMYFFADLGLIDPACKEPADHLVYNGYINAADGNKMSKSKGNVVDPLEIIDQGYGADALRVYELFIGPYELDAAWDVGGIAGSYRFLNRVWTVSQEFIAASNDLVESPDVLIASHRATKKVTDDLDRLSFNTAISGLMEFVNDLYKMKLSGIGGADWRLAIESLVKLLAPFAPHLSEELWSQLGHKNSIHISPWPQYDDTLLVEDTVSIVIQVNGKVRGSVSVANGSSEDLVIAAAQIEENVARYVSKTPIKKTIYIQNKLVNFVI